MLKLALASLGVALALSFSSGAQAQETLTVLADSTLNGNAGMIVQDVEPDWESNFFLFVEGDKVRFYAVRENYAPDWAILPGAQYLVKPTGMTIGDTWRGLDTDAGQETVATVKSFQPIIVPAGAFNCFEVEFALASDPSLIDAVFWFSDSVGLVRQDFYDLNIPGDPLTDRSELSSFSLVGGSGYLPMAVGNQWSYTTTVATDETSWGQLKSQY